jgi:hypothetical protein
MVHNWSDVSFNDLMCILTWLLLKPSKVPSRHISSKEACQPVHDGCGMNSCMSKSLYFVSLSNSDKYHVFSAS